MLPISVPVCLSLGRGERPELFDGLALGHGKHVASQEGSPTRTITLHHRIRQSSNPYAPSIKAFDTRLQRGEVFPKEDLAR